MASTQVINPAKTQQEIARPLAHFPNSIWGDRFYSFNLDNQVYEMHAKEIETSKEQVKGMITTTECKTVDKLTLIDIIERLGISYHFEKEIREQLEQIFNRNANFEDNTDYDLSMAAIQFRLLRQYGFSICSGVFDKFMNDEGKFKDSLSNDIKGLLNLYEAAQLRGHKDHILEEAVTFTTAQLNSVAQNLSCSLGKQVKHALVQTLHRGIPRIEARHYISIYELDERKNGLLLRLAKLDYNLVQMLHKRELSELLRWWKELDVVSKLPYARDRLVEGYYLALAVYSQPQYSEARIILTKTIAMISIIDDTYDAYGTLAELETLTDAVERWHSSTIDELQGCMKTCYVALLGQNEELAEYSTKLGKSYAAYHVKEAWKQYARCSNTQSIWFTKGDLPPFPEYMSIGLFTSAYQVIATASFVGMNSATEVVYDWLVNSPKILGAAMKNGRLINDAASHEFEKKRGTATAIDCYMKHYNVSEQEAMKKFEEISEEAWKDINEEYCLKPTTMPREILAGILNLARIMDVTYKHNEDGYTHPEKVIEPHIISLLVDPILV